MLKRLAEQKDFLLAHYKKGRSKKASKITKNLKKIFNPKREADARMLKKQLNLLGQRNMLECQSLYLSVKVRELAITQQILALQVENDNREVDE